MTNKMPEVGQQYRLKNYKDYVVHIIEIQQNERNNHHFNRILLETPNKSERWIFQRDLNEDYEELPETKEQHKSQLSDEVQVALDELKKTLTDLDITIANTKVGYDYPRDPFSEHLRLKAQNLIDALESQNQSDNPFCHPEGEPKPIYSKKERFDRVKELMTKNLIKFPQYIGVDWATQRISFDKEEEIKIENISYEDMHKKPEEKPESTCSNCNNELGITACRSDFKLGVFCSASCANAINSVPEEKPKSIWRPVDEMPSFCADVLIREYTGEVQYGYFGYGNNQEGDATFFDIAHQRRDLDFSYRLRPYQFKEWCYLTDFINEHDQLKSRIDKLEKIVAEIIETD